VQHDSSSVLAMATNTLHNALCVILNLFKNLRSRIAIVRSAWRQPNSRRGTSSYALCPRRRPSECHANYKVREGGRFCPQNWLPRQRPFRDRENNFRAFIYGRWTTDRCIVYKPDTGSGLVGSNRKRAPVLKSTIPLRQAYSVASTSIARNLSISSSN